MILRRLLRPRGPLPRRFSAETPTTSPSQTLHRPSDHLLSPPPAVHCPLPSLSPPPKPVFPLSALAGTITLAASSLALAALLSDSDRLPAEVRQTLEKSKASAQRVADRMVQTGAAATVLWKSLASVLSSAEQGVRSGFELRVAALLADIVAANGARRAAIVEAGGGAVVDWLLESVAGGRGGNGGGDQSGTQAESARALAYLIADPSVGNVVLGRPGAVPNLLRFIFSFQPKRRKKHFKQSSLDGADLSKGRSMLVAALMDIITANCDNIDQSSFQPLLPANADMRDIAAALAVVEEGGMHFDDNGSDDNDDGDKGIKGIGIKVLGGTAILGFSKTDKLLQLETHDKIHLEPTAYVNKNVAVQENNSSSPKLGGLASVTVPGLWDDLQREHVAVPFAAWALANWALASDLNRSHIQELDRDGHAVMAALTAQERTVKWHGSLVARALLDDQNLPLTVSVPDWSSSLLSIAFQASKFEDMALAQVAFSAFLVSVERSDDAKMATVDKGLLLMRGIAKQTEKHKNLQESVARVLELLYSGNMHLSLEESQRWSDILLHWIFGTISSDATRSSAIKILSCILEDFGPATIPISQGWLAIMLNEILGASKKSTLSSPLRTDNVKSQIDQSNALSAAQVANQLSLAVIKLARNKVESEPDSVDGHPLADFLSLEPFAALIKSTNKTNTPKFDAADSAFATLRGIKALTELCSGDAQCQNKIADFGGLCLLRRFLLGDDYEKLAAIETYDASRVLDTQERGSTVSGDQSAYSNDPSSIRVPPTAHIRRHAARLLTVLSLLPNVKKTIIADEKWCKWLEDCASGRVPCCNDLKVQSYARAVLLNIFCSDRIAESVINDRSGMEGGNQRTRCAQYEDMIFLINPELPHWKCSQNDLNDLVEQSVSDAYSSPSHDDGSITTENANCSITTENANYSSSVNGLQSETPVLDVVFIHGLRGGPFKSWRISDNKSSTTSKAGLVENIDQEAGKEGTCWPREWLSADFPYARLFSVKYKTNLTQWSGASLPLQEVSSMLLQKLLAAGIGNRPTVFVTHSMGGLVVKQMLHQAKINNFNKFVNNTIGVVFYSCPHSGSKLADMPLRMGLVFRPAPTIGELKSGSPRLNELNDFVRHLNNKGQLEVLSFSETQVTPIVEGYGGWVFRAEIVTMESAFPGFGELVVLEGTDHINSCKPVNRTDPSYAKTLEFLEKLKDRLT